MFVRVFAVSLGLFSLFCAPVAVSEQSARSVAIGVPAQQGPVDGTDQLSDEFIWRKLVEFAAPVVPGQRSPVAFEVWASDNDTFNTDPKWPDPAAEKQFQRSVLQAAKHPGLNPIDIACTPPPGAATGRFPITGCIAEETKRNRPMFDYIVKHELNTQSGLAKAFAANFNVQMPTTAVSIKGDWVPVDDLMEWLPQLDTVEKVRAQYYTNVSKGVEYAVASIHISSRQNPNWVWGSFENQNNPGRCDFIGCRDSFGAVVPVVEANLRTNNGGYGTCEKTPALKALMAKAGLDPAWANYCMKATMTEYTADDGTPYVLGNSVIEGIVGNGTVAASSCIGCHVYASFDQDGKVAASASSMLPYNPTGRPLEQPLIGSSKFDFMWGVIKAPK